MMLLNKTFYLKKLCPVAMVLITLLLGIGCVRKDIDLTIGKTPQQITEAVISKSSQIKNYEFESYIHSGHDTSIRGKISSEKPSTEYFDFYEGNRPSSVFSIYSKGTRSYIKSVKMPWLPLEENIMERSSVELYMNEIASINPTPALKKIYNRKISVKRMPDEKIAGYNTVVIEIVTDFTQPIPPPGNLDSGPKNPVDSVKVTLWARKNDLLVYRYYVQGKVSMNNQALAVTATTNISGYNKTKITTPEEVKKFQIKL